MFLGLWVLCCLYACMGIIPIVLRVLRVSPGDESACARLGRRAVRGLGPGYSGSAKADSSVK